ncbi:MAG TPA: hypothetical protein VK574_01425 [Terracidiphilus sp.]|nr:hypothetical protein [Terracidiphilus sp.]
MFKECRYILPSGYKCKSPALRDKHFCYFHNKSRRYAAIRSTSTDPIVFPSVEDTGGVQIALNQVLRNFGARRINARHAGILFYGLQIASQLAHKSDEKLSESVRETCEDSDGYTLAPEKTTCEPPDDCQGCHHREGCEDFELYKGEIEAFEKQEAHKKANENREKRN